MKTCPQCRLLLERMEGEEADIWFCRLCGGHWLPADQVQRALASRNALLARLEASGGGVTEGMFADLARPCPDCGTVALAERPWPSAPASVVLGCERCDGVWLEAGRAAEIAVTVQAAPPASSMMAAPARAPEEAGRTAEASGAATPTAASSAVGVPAEASVAVPAEASAPPANLSAAAMMASEAPPATTPAAAGAMPVSVPAFEPPVAPDARSASDTHVAPGARAAESPSPAGASTAQSVAASGPLTIGSPVAHDDRASARQESGLAAPPGPFRDVVPTVSQPVPTMSPMSPAETDAAENDRTLEMLARSGAALCCPRCLMVRPVEERECPQCGVPLVEADHQVACPRCHGANTITDTSCRRCREPLRTEERLDGLYPARRRGAPKPSAGTPPPGARASSEHPFWCPQCRRGFETPETFCRECGVPLVRADRRVACPECRKEVAIGGRVCPYCAADLHPEWLRLQGLRQAVGTPGSAHSAPPPVRIKRSSASGAIPVLASLLLVAAVIAATQQFVFGLMLAIFALNLLSRNRKP